MTHDTLRAAAEAALVALDDVIERLVFVCGIPQFSDSPSEVARAKANALRAALSQEPPAAAPAQGERPKDAPMLWRKAVMEAYGHLWHVNNEPMAPIPLRSPEKAAYEARKCLRELLTTSERGEAIRAVGALIENSSPSTPKPARAFWCSDCAEGVVPGHCRARPINSACKFAALPHPPAEGSKT